MIFSFYILGINNRNIYLNSIKYHKYLPTLYQQWPVTNRNQPIFLVPKQIKNRRMSEEFYRIHRRCGIGKRFSRFANVHDGPPKTLAWLVLSRTWLMQMFSQNIKIFNKFVDRFRKQCFCWFWFQQIKISIFIFQRQQINK